MPIQIASQNPTEIIYLQLTFLKIMNEIKKFRKPFSWTSFGIPYLTSLHIYKMENFKVMSMKKITHLWTLFSMFEWCLNQKIRIINEMQLELTSHVGVLKSPFLWICARFGNSKSYIRWKFCEMQYQTMKSFIKDQWKKLILMMNAFCCAYN